MNVEVRGDATGRGLYAARGFRAGETVLAFPDATLQGQRDRHTVEHPSGRHVRHPVLAFTAHACEPNAAIDFDRMALVALRSIAQGEPISIDYEATETVIAHPFRCLCGANTCRGSIPSAPGAKETSRPLRS